MSKPFPLCEYSEENEFVCLECPYPTACPFEILEKRQMLKEKKKRDEETEREEKRIMEELLEAKWQAYHKYHPNGESESTYKAIQKSKLLYAKEYRARKKKSG